MLVWAGKKVLGKREWKNRAVESGGELDKVLSASDEALIMWILDGWWNNWVMTIGKNEMIQDAYPQNCPTHHGRPVGQAWFGNR